jgi:hypothetical protein
MTGHQGYKSRTITRQRNRIKHKLMGLCVQCSKKVFENHIRCKKHFIKQKESIKKSREKKWK